MYKITPIQLAKGIRPKSMYTHLTNFYETIEIFYGVFLIQGRGKNILVDSGIEAKEYTKISSHKMEDIQSLSCGLQRNGLSKENINFLIQTHLHFDHCLFLKDFRHIPKYIQKKEVEYAYSPHPLFQKLYPRSYFDNVSFELLEGDVEILPGLKVLLVPGHSPGCQAVSIQTDEGVVGISGFCCIEENFLPKGAILDENDVVIPAYHENVYMAFDSVKRIKKICDFVYPIHQKKLVKLRNI